MLNLEEIKKCILVDIEKNKEGYINISHAIHSNPEMGNQEFFASQILNKKLEENGFNIERGVAGHPTAFIARKKASKQGVTIGYLAEYDALPNLGHACGHNIIGTTSIASAIALSKVIHEIGGEIVVLGTPAEEGGENGSAKASFVKNNLLKGIDFCMMIHPSSETSITCNSLAVDPLDFEFIGKSAHAAACPEKGINALDAVIQLYNGINALRQHVTNDVRIHGIITHGGDMPNIVPNYAKARFYIRAATRKRCDEVTRKVKEIARGAALITGAEVNIIPFQNSVDNLLINKEFDKEFEESMKYLGINIKTENVKGIGSTDAGNISQVVPTIHPYIKIGKSELVAHTKEFCDAAVSKEGDNALIIGAKALALTGFNLLTNRQKVEKIKEEFKKTKAL
ncbi:amidohydrolase [Clostridium tetanomorphum]|uniref:Peptidase M20 domain-containing protein 2 n=1 Tax=Clostridium tetanomorphum TaxID=1553 RepID=A0A923EBT7_CLOTT|nr:M20 family metallopeptidase [Clostridium tetanomorphum]KAJ53091.1 amidohydrolase [Clostridium tetanomorphum DSM 665]MBC2398371.1 M20 family metallopeptidase [Clostridium tetanomorphum]MBP1865524.1 amidohydrolase [Clostridium tetanomorphum]NRS86470.1 amidohydrolase [Clostridium tetanomorphum]NRZ95501.1 amidohydrolase [Clostridium tetanomorphum]